MLGAHKILKVMLFALALTVIACVAVFVLLQPDPRLASLPKLTTAVFNHAGDPINILLVGNKDSITKAFLAVHWLVPNPISASSTAKIIEAGIANSAYPRAPVSNLHLFGRVQDLSFELPTDTVRQRHHIRLWQTTDMISGAPLWVGAASYDSGLELSGITALPTHRISPNIGAERDFIARSLESRNLVQSKSSERIGYPTLWAFNGGGDWYFYDGVALVLTIR